MPSKDSFHCWPYTCTMEVKEWMDPDFWNERTKDLRNKEKWHKRQNVSNLTKVGVSCRFGFLFLFSLILVSNDFQSTRVTLFPCVPKLSKSQNSSFWIFDVIKRPKRMNFLIYNKYFSNIQWFILFIFFTNFEQAIFILC